MCFLFEKSKNNFFLLEKIRIFVKTNKHMITVTNREDFRVLCSKLVELVSQETLINDFPRIFSTNQFINKSTSAPYGQSKIGSLFIKTHFSNEGLCSVGNKLIEKYADLLNRDNDADISIIDEAEKQYEDYLNCGLTSKITFTDFLQFKRSILLSLKK